MKATTLLLVVAALGLGACDFDLTDPNNPPPIGNDPTLPQIQAAMAGILVSARSDAADWNLDAGIIGREAYRFDGSDPRFITELLEGPLDPGGGAFGGDHWGEWYATIRTSNSLLNVIGTASVLNAAQQNATRGFAETIQAYAYLMVLMGHAEDSIPVDVNRPVTDPPAPFVTNDSAYHFVSNLLDTADAHLAVASAAFPFDPGPGFSDATRGNFGTPALFRQVNRALKARVEAFRGSLGCGVPCYNDALTALAGSFIDTLGGAATLDNGAYHVYSTRPGDIVNPLFQNPLTGENLVHRSLRDSVESKSGGGFDNRYTAKVTDRNLASAGTPPLSSDLGWLRYPTADAPVPIIRNEELILLRAEANNAIGQGDAAARDINYIRVTSGGLDSIAGLGAQTQAQIRNQMLREKKYSLLYEGHRWNDMRRFGLLGSIIIDRPGTDAVHPTLPTPLAEVLPRLP